MTWIVGSGINVAKSSNHHSAAGSVVSNSNAGRIIRLVRIVRLIRILFTFKLLLSRLPPFKAFGIEFKWSSNKFVEENDTESNVGAAMTDLTNKRWVRLHRRDMNVDCSPLESLFLCSRCMGSFRYWLSTPNRTIPGMLPHIWFTFLRLVMPLIQPITR